MSSGSSPRTGSTPLSTPLGSTDRLRDTHLAEWMGVHIPEYRGPLRIERFVGGQSNPTYKVITPERSYVLRTKPYGHVLKGAHAIEREARVMKALGSIGFPVPRMLEFCADEDVIGTPFFLMDMVEGRIFADASLPEVERPERAAYFREMNETIARLHTVDYVAIGLEDYGRPGNYVERQIARLSKQYFADSDAGRDPMMDRLIDCLSANIPPSEGNSRIVHGDFRFENLIFDPTEPRVVAVLDWELSTIGEPLADFAYNAMMYRLPRQIFTGLDGYGFAELNIPSEEDYIALYCERTGRSDLPNFDFYVAFNLFRLAAIFHGIKGRMVRGTASSEHASDRVRHLPEILALAWTQAQRAIAAKKA